MYRRFGSGAQVKEEVMRMAKPTAIFMHCLPAQRGQEVTDDVAESKQSVIFDQVHLRSHMALANLALET